MKYVAVVFALLAGLLHVVIFWMESIAWTRPQIWKRFSVASQDVADTTRPMAYNQGFYNLSLAVGAIVGGVLVLVGNATVGWTLVVSACGSMLLAALVLVSSGRHYARAAFSQGLLPAVAVVAAVVALV